MLTETLKDGIRKQAVKELPNECCGLIIDEQTGTRLFPCRNAADNPIDFFQISAKDFLHASKLGKILAYYHSHQANVGFSDYDKLISMGQGIRAILYKIPTDTFDVFLSEADAIGEFEYGHKDCLSFFIEYFSQLGIVVPDLIGDRNAGLFRERKDVFANGGYKTLYAPYGFRLIGKDDLKKHDVLCFLRAKPLSFHVAIYLGDGTMTHRIKGLGITVTDATEFIGRATEIFRHKNYDT